MKFNTRGVSFELNENKLPTIKKLRDLYKFKKKQKVIINYRYGDSVKIVNKKDMSCMVVGDYGNFVLFLDLDSNKKISIMKTEFLTGEATLKKVIE